jgi:hypothetical protein
MDARDAETYPGVAVVNPKAPGVLGFEDRNASAWYAVAPTARRAAGAADPQKAAGNVRSTAGYSRAAGAITKKAPALTPGQVSLSVGGRREWEKGQGRVICSTRKRPDPVGGTDRAGPNPSHAKGIH